MSHVTSMCMWRLLVEYAYGCTLVTVADDMSGEVEARRAWRVCKVGHSSANAFEDRGCRGTSRGEKDNPWRHPARPLRGQGCEKGSCTLPPSARPPSGADRARRAQNICEPGAGLLQGSIARRATALCALLRPVAPSCTALSGAHAPLVVHSNGSQRRDTSRDEGGHHRPRSGGCLSLSACSACL